MNRRLLAGGSPPSTGVLLGVLAAPVGGLKSYVLSWCLCFWAFTMLGLGWLAGVCPPYLHAWLKARCLSETMHLPTL
jgi:hypothetical protein